MRKIVLSIFVMGLFVSDLALSNETKTTFGNKSWQFRSAGERFARTQQAVLMERQKMDHGLGVGGRLGTGGDINIANVEQIGVLGSASNCINCSETVSLTQVQGNGNEVGTTQTTDQNATNSDQNAEANNNVDDSFNNNDTN